MSEPEELIRAQAAQIVRLRAELAESERTNALLMRNAAENWQTKAAIARVRGLCESGVEDRFRIRVVPGRMLLRALDGAE